jgi:transposase
MKRTRWTRLKRPWHLNPNQQIKLQAIAKTNRRLGTAYLLKESFAAIYDSLAFPADATVQVEAWLRSATRSRNSAFVRVARTIRQHLAGILSFFETGYTSGRCEGLNTKARLATRQAFSFHSAAAIMVMIELRCGGIAIPLPHVA